MFHGLFLPVLIMSVPWLQIKVKNWQRAAFTGVEGKSKKFVLNPESHEIEEGNKIYIVSIPSKITGTTDSYVCIGLIKSH